MYSIFVDRVKFATKISIKRIEVTFGIGKKYKEETFSLSQNYVLRSDAEGKSVTCCGSLDSFGLFRVR